MATSVHIPQVFTSTRRYYLGKRLEAKQRGELALAATWRAKQESEPGTDLAEGFPATEQLAAAGYTTEQDLLGATQEELLWVGLTITQAEAVIKAVAEL